MTAVPRPATWLVMPADRDVKLGWAACLRCRQTFYGEHRCPYEPDEEELSRETLVREAEELEQLAQLYEGWGWACCLHCRGVYHHGFEKEAHGCSLPPPPRPPRVERPTPRGSLDGMGRIYTPPYGSRVSTGSWMLNGCISELPSRERYRHRELLEPCPANKACYESIEEARYWAKWRRRRIFLTKRPELCGTAFLREADRIYVHPHVPGDNYASSHNRFRVIGAAEWYGKELVIDLGFWLGAGYMYGRLDDACKAATQAILRRWAADIPEVKAGFSWGHANT